MASEAVRAQTRRLAPGRQGSLSVTCPCRPLSHVFLGSSFPLSEENSNNQIIYVLLLYCHNYHIAWAQLSNSLGEDGCADEVVPCHIVSHDLNEIHVIFRSGQYPMTYIVTRSEGEEFYM